MTNNEKDYIGPTGIESKPEIMGGDLVIAGTRIPIERVLYLIHQQYPQLTEESIKALLIEIFTRVKGRMPNNETNKDLRELLREYGILTLPYLDRLEALITKQVNEARIDEQEKLLSHIMPYVTIMSDRIAELQTGDKDDFKGE